MKSQNNIKAISVATQAGVPVLLVGSPGIGKTSVIMAMAEKLSLPIEVVIASLREPSDFAGLPVLDDGQVYLSPPAWAKRLKDMGRGILMFDELSTAPPSTQAATLRTVQDRVAGELQLPDEVAIIACMNPPESASGAFDLSAPMSNRFMHVQWSIDHTDWCDGIISGFPIPDIDSVGPEWRKGLPQARALVSSFINARPTLLNQQPEDESSAGKAWASPRTWDMASTLLSAWQSTGYNEDVLALLISGAVGDQTALEFMTYREQLDLPDPEELLKDPKSLQLPERGDRVYAILSSLTASVISNNTVDRWNAGWAVLGEAVEQGSADIAASAAKGLIKNRPEKAGLPDQITHFVPLLKGAGLL